MLKCNSGGMYPVSPECHIGVCNISRYVSTKMVGDQSKWLLNSLDFTVSFCHEIGKARIMVVFHIQSIEIVLIYSLSWWIFPYNSGDVPLKNGEFFPSKTGGCSPPSSPGHSGWRRLLSLQGHTALAMEIREEDGDDRSGSLPFIVL